MANAPHDRDFPLRLGPTVLPRFDSLLHAEGLLPTDDLLPVHYANGHVSLDELRRPASTLPEEAIMRCAAQLENGLDRLRAAQGVEISIIGMTLAPFEAGTPTVALPPAPAIFKALAVELIARHKKADNFLINITPFESNRCRVFLNYNAAHLTDCGFEDLARAAGLDAQWLNELYISWSHALARLCRTFCYANFIIQESAISSHDRLEASRIINHLRDADLRRALVYPII